MRFDADAVPAFATFEDFYLREYRSVVALAFVLSGNGAIAEDLAQDAFLAAHRAWDRVSSLDRPGAWVRRAVANRSVSIYRRQIAEARVLVQLASRERLRVAELPAAEAEFWDAVRALPRRQRQAIALFYLEDLPVADIADVLGMAQGTVKKHLSDGRGRLAKSLGEEASRDGR
jgi:RNA polymerase sigma factor (sigma-70 family)